MMAKKPTYSFMHPVTRKATVTPSNFAPFSIEYVTPPFSRLLGIKDAEAEDAGKITLEILKQSIKGWSLDGALPDAISDMEPELIGSLSKVVLGSVKRQKN